MMARYDVVRATEEHALELATNMRDADVQEVWAASHWGPEEALLVSLRASLDPKTGLADGRIICMFGVAQFSLLSDLGVPWLLTASELPDHAGAFLRRSRAYVAEARLRYSLLLNYVDARNIMCVRWLRWLGFEVLPPRAFGVDQLPFHAFKMERG